MSCNDFEMVVKDLIRNHSMEAKKKEEALIHAKSCVRCAARLPNEKFLANALRVTAKAERASAPAHVKANLLAAFAANCGNEVSVNPRPYFVRTSASGSNRFAWLFAWQWAAVATVIVVALISAATMRSLFMQPKDKLQQAVTAYSNDITIPEHKDKPENRVQSPRTPLLKNTNVQIAYRYKNKNALRPKPVKQPSIENQTNNEITSEFIALTYTNETSAIDSGMVVRVKVPRATLIAMGLPMNAANKDGYVKADLVVGDDGVARAIRLVQDSSSTTETKQKSN